MKARRRNVDRNRLQVLLQGKRESGLKRRDEEGERINPSVAQSMLESGMSVAQVVALLGLRRSMNSVNALRSASGRVHREPERNGSEPGDARDFRFRDEHRAHTHIGAEVP